MKKYIIVATMNFVNNGNMATSWQNGDSSTVIISNSKNEDTQRQRIILIDDISLYDSFRKYLFSARIFTKMDDIFDLLETQIHIIKNIKNSTF
jgi:hypothetical protein